MAQYVRTPRQPLTAISLSRENTPVPGSYSTPKRAEQENVSPSPKQPGKAKDPNAISVDFPPGPMGMDLEPVIVSSQRKIGCRIKGFRAEPGHFGVDPIKLRQLVKVGDIVKEINGKQVLSAPFEVILDALRQLKRVSRTIVFKDISANWVDGGVSEPRSQNESFSPSSVKKRAQQRSTNTRSIQAVHNSDFETDDASTSFVWRYMQNMVAPFAERVEQAAQTLTATASHIPTVTSLEFAQVMQTKNQLLQELADAYNQLERVDRTNHQLIQQNAEGGKLQHLVELDRQSLLVRCGWLEQQLDELAKHKEFVNKQWKDSQAEVEQLHDQVQRSRQSSHDLERQLKATTTQLLHKSKECEHKAQKLEDLQGELDGFAEKVHTHPLVVELEAQMQRLRSDVEQAHSMLAAERERQNLEQQQMMEAIQVRDQAVVEELTKLQSEHAELYDQHQTFVNDSQRETLDWHAKLQDKDKQILHQQAALDELHRQLTLLQEQQQNDREAHNLQVATFEERLQNQSIALEHEQRCHEQLATQLQNARSAASERDRMADGEIEALRAQNEQLASQLQLSQSKINQLLGENTELARALEASQQAFENAQGMLEQQQLANAQLQDEVGQYEQEFDKVQQARQQQELECETLSQRLEESKHDSDEAAKQHQQQMLELQAAVAQLGETHAQEFADCHQEYAAQLEQREQELEQARSALTEAEAEHKRALQAKQGNLQRSEQALAAAVKAKRLSNAELANLQAKTHAMKSHLKGMSAIAKELRRDMAKQQAFVATQHQAHEVLLRHVAENLTGRVRTLTAFWQQQFVHEQQANEQRVAALEAAHKLELKAIQQAHSHDTRSANEEHAEYLRQLNDNVAELQERLKELETDQQKRIDRVEAKEDARRARLQAEHERETTELHAMFDAQLEQMLEAHRQELQTADVALLHARKSAEESRQQEQQQHKQRHEKLLVDLNAARDSMAGMMSTIQAQELALMQAMEQIAELQSCSNTRAKTEDEHNVSRSSEDDSVGTSTSERVEIERMIEERDRLMVSMAELEDNHAALQVVFERQKQELEDVRLLVEAITNDGPEVDHNQQDGDISEDVPATNALELHQDASRQHHLTRVALKKRRIRISGPKVKDLAMQKAFSKLLTRQLHREILRRSFLQWRHAQLHQTRQDQLFVAQTVEDESTNSSDRSVVADVVEASMEGESFWTISTTDSEHTDVFNTFV